MQSCSPIAGRAPNTWCFWQACPEWEPLKERADTQQTGLGSECPAQCANHIQAHRSLCDGLNQWEKGSPWGLTTRSPPRSRRACAVDGFPSSTPGSEGLIPTGPSVGLFNVPEIKGLETPELCSLIGYSQQRKEGRGFSMEPLVHAEPCEIGAAWGDVEGK